MQMKNLSKVFITLLLLVRLVAGDVAGVAPLIIAVVTGHDLLIPGLLPHHHLLHTRPTSVHLSLGSNLISLYFNIWNFRVVSDRLATNDFYEKQPCDTGQYHCG